MRILWLMVCRCLTVTSVPAVTLSRSSSRVLLGVVLGVVLACSSALAGGPARADQGDPNRASTSAKASSYLCTGYAGCRGKGYSNAGYRSASDTMWWRMYTGHNCTNYAAYRVVRSGLPNRRPWEGEGNADNWGRALPQITDGVPMVGSVAWWKRGRGGAGSSGHVAYVEQVVSSREIIISEDSWGGDFHWRRVTRGQGSWPSGFLHFNDARVPNASAPVVSGVAQVGETLSASSGRWKVETSIAYQWLADGEPIAGATAASYTPVARDEGRTVAVRVTASARGYRDSQRTSTPTSRVVPGVLRPTAQPRISGTARLHETLHLAGATWDPSPSRTRVQWYAGQQPIDGATSASLRLGKGQVGERITAVVTATRAGYRSSTVTSDPTERVQAGRIEVTSPFVLTGAARHGRTLRVTPGTVEPGDVRVSYTWLRDGRVIDGAVERAYSLRGDDVGHRVTVRVDLRRDAYEPKHVLLSPHAVTTTEPRLTVDATGRPGRAVVHLRVRAPGIERPGGSAVVTVGGRKVTGRVVDGRLRVLVSDLSSGRTKVVVTYAGTRAIEPGRVTSSVRVPRD